jgi:hypothetical protein
MAKNTKTYTFLLEFKGGTYISQIEAGSPKTALTKWSESLNIVEIEGIEGKMKEQIKDDAKVQEPSLLQGMNNVWCATFLLADNLALVNFVQTESI